MGDIPNKSNAEVMAEAFPQKNDPAPDATTEPDPVNEAALKLIGASKYQTPKFGR